MIINEQIAWRRGHVDLAREPQAEDVAQGLAGILFSGELLMNEGSRVEVVEGKLLFTSGRSSFGRKVGAAVEKGYRESEPAAGQTQGQSWGLRFETAENGKMYLAGIGQGISIKPSPLGPETSGSETAPVSARGGEDPFPQSDNAEVILQWLVRQLRAAGQS